MAPHAKAEKVKDNARKVLKFFKGGSSFSDLFSLTGTGILQVIASVGTVATAALTAVTPVQVGKASKDDVTRFGIHIGFFTPLAGFCMNFIGGGFPTHLTLQYFGVVDELMWSSFRIVGCAK